MKKAFKMNFSFLSIFHHFKRAFIEAYKTIFLEGETPTITIHSIIKNIFSCSVKCIEYSFSVVNLVFYPTSFLLFDKSFYYCTSFLLLHTEHFDESIALPPFVIETFGFLLIFFLHLKYEDNIVP